MKTILSIVILFFSCGNTYAQVPSWVSGIGGVGNDVGNACKVGPNGNVCVTGRFSGTVDLDPGPGIHNITSHGQTDIFLACYSPGGVFLWGFGIGGADYDGANNIDIDPFNNVIIVGFFQGGADFDPGGGSAVIPFAGGTGLSYEGDGFVAKYSSSGAFQWAKSLGGATVYDVASGVATDPTGNVYVGGEFDNTMVVSGSITFSSAAAGTGYLIKYDPAGTVTWAHNFGELGIAAVDCAVRCMRVVGGNIYACGTFRGSANFNPWGTPAVLSSSGPSDFDGFVAKYDDAGNFVFVRQVEGSGELDEVLGIALDVAGNIYVTGFGNSPSFIFNTAVPAASTVSAQGGGGNYDMFIARYDNAGTFQWGKAVGGTGDDVGHAIEVVGGSLFAAGEFMNTVDFDPSATVANLVSNGNADIYFVKYDLSGNYMCGFNVGSSAADDIGYGLAHDIFGNLYITGQFGGAATDFDPSPAVYPVSSVGDPDAFLAKYSYIGGPFTGTVKGDTICAGDAVHFTLDITSGALGPYNITLTSGSVTAVIPGASSGVPFIISPAPLVTTTYHYIVAAAGGSPGLCAALGVPITGTVTIVVHPLPVVSPTVTVNCGSATVSAPAGYTSYHWDFGDSSISAVNPASHTYASGGMHTVSVTVVDINGCSGSVAMPVNVPGDPVVDLGPDVSLCPGDPPATLHSSIPYAAPVYLWSTGSHLPSITAGAGPYWLRVTVAGCSGSDTVIVTNRPLPVVDLGPDKSICDGQSVSIHSSVAYTTPSYFWSTGDTSSSIAVGTGGDYILNVTQYGCKAGDTIHVNVKPLPVVTLPAQATICSGATVTISVTEPQEVTYLWSTGSTEPSISVTKTGIYTLEVTADGCSSKATVNVVDLVPPTPVSMGADTVLCTGEELVVNLGNDAARWSDGSVGQSFTITKKGVYWVSVTNECGTVVDTMLVDYQPCNIWFPNAFTPNGDGKNDIARVSGLLDFYKDFRLSIFNRFGQRLFYTEDIYAGWDGTFNGIKQDLGTYFYMILYTIHGRDQMLKGDVQLIR